MSPDLRTSKSNTIRDFKDALMMKVFVNPRVVFRQEMVGNILSIQKRRRRSTVFLVEEFEDFNAEHKIISSKYFRFNGLYLIVLVNGKIPEIEEIFKRMWKIQIYKVVLIYEEDDEVLVYTFFPFNDIKCDDTTPVLINKIINGRILNETEFFFPKKMKNLFSCPIRASVSNSAIPLIIPVLHANESSSIQGPEIKLIETLADALNFKIITTFFSDESYTFDNGSTLRSFKATIESDGEVDISIGNWWIKSIRLQFFDCTCAYSIDQLVLLVPPGFKLTAFEKLIYPFAPAVWFMVLAVFFIGFVVIKITSQRSAKVRNFVFGKRVQQPNLNLLIPFVGGMQKILPRRNFARFLLMNFLLYSLVMRTLYQASFYQLLQSNEGHKPVESLDEIIKNDFKIYVTTVNSDMLEGTDAIKERF